MSKKDRADYTLHMDELTLHDYRDYEKAVGTKLLDALSPRVVKDDEGKPIPNPADEGRPYRLVQPTMDELIGLIWIVRRMHARNGGADPKTVTLEDTGNLRMTGIKFDVDWGIDDDDDAAIVAEQAAGENPTVPVAPATESTSEQS